MALFDFNQIPGLGAARTTAEVNFLWGKHEQSVFRSALIKSTSTDVNNTVDGSSELRPGLVMALLSDGTWVPYNPVASDGSQIAAGINCIALRMTDILTNTADNRMGVICVSGPVKTNQLIRNVSNSPTIDPQARAQLSDKFIFDDQLYANSNPWINVVAKTADYQVKLADSGTEFVNTGASGSVTFTLPALNDANGNAQCKGVLYRFTDVAAKTLAVKSTGSDGVIFFNNNANHTFTLSTGGSQIGVTLEVRTDDQGANWLLTILNAPASAVTAS